MMKKIIEDIKPKKIQDFKPKIQKVDQFNEDQAGLNSSPKNSTKKRLSSSPRVQSEPSFIRRPFLITLIFFLLAGLVFWLSVLFEKAEIIIEKKTETINLNHALYQASKGFNSGIPFEIMIVTDTEKEYIKLTESSQVSNKAEGEIIIYNEYSQKSENLQSGTYLSDETGKVYLTDKAISVPGYKREDGKIIPGQASVRVVSFLPGEAYNGEPTDFYINAFSGTSKYKKIYGKAQTSITGGALGTYYFLKEENAYDLASIANSSLKNNLIKKIDSLIPNDYIFYSNAFSFSYRVDENIISLTSDAEIEILGELEVVLLKKKELTETILKTSLPQVKKEELNVVDISGIKDLTFNFVDNNQVIDKELESFKFELTGDLLFTWNPGIEKLKKDLVGIPKDSLQEIFKKDVGVGEAKVKIFPPWNSVLPTEISKIKIRVL